ncbi:MAG: hypothetical protein LBG80_17195 [Bacteroidales bacterium]|jgi:hypothetical protein|nr:hypothetical protein [Bacteroidales bacterium]
MDNEKRIIIGRPINGISINGLEYALDEHGKVKEFSDKKEAVQFLKDNGTLDEDMDYYIFEEIETKIKKSEKNQEPLRKAVSKNKRPDRDDDRWW